MKKRGLLIVGLVLCMMTVGCTKTTKIDDVGAGDGNVKEETTISSSEQLNNDEETESTPKKESKNQDTELISYYNYDINFYMPYIHSYDGSAGISRIYDTSEVFMVGAYIDKTDLDKIFDSLVGQRLDSGLSIESYQISNQESYTTDTGFEGIRYEGTLKRKDYEKELYFYGFAFNGKEKSHMLIGISTDEKEESAEESYNMDEIKKEIQSRVDSAIDNMKDSD